MGFPQGFVWGAGSAAYQVEGAWDADGKGESIWDAFCHTPGRICREETGDTAADAYNRYPTDIALMRRLGLQAYRFSISWPRVLPTGCGTVNTTGLAYYDRLVDLLLENGITPYVTLYHWDMPQTLEQQGGWCSRDIAHTFAEFAAYIARHFDKRVRHYITFNEPQCFLSLGYHLGLHAPGKRLPPDELANCIRTVLLAHGEAVSAIRASVHIPVQIGLASTGRICYPIGNITPNAREAAKNATFALSAEDWMFSHTWLLDAVLFGNCPTDIPPLRMLSDSLSAQDWSSIRQPLDFLGLNAYNGRPVDADGREIQKHPGFPRTSLKWPITPEILFYGTKFLYKRYGLPIYITENGQSCNDRIFLDGGVHDPDRIDFLYRYLCELKQATEEGVPVLGYFHWSLTDNFEWHSGYDERFGLVYIDYPTQRRILKDSALWYANTILHNGANLSFPFRDEAEIRRPGLTPRYKPGTL